MKKKLLTILVFSAIAVTALAQAKKPSIMIVPSDLWCNKNGYVQQFDNQGVMVTVPDYTAALQNDMNLKMSIANIESMMTDRGFPLTNLEQTLKQIAVEEAENNMMMSKDGGEVLENPVDKLRRVAKSDIIMELSWEVNQIGPKMSVSYILAGIDAYSLKNIATSTSVSTPSLSADVPTLLSEAVVSNIDNFNSQLMTHFDEMSVMGREVAVDIRVFDNMEGIDLETEYEYNDDKYELVEIIDDWMYMNTQEHRYNKVSSSENVARFNQVRIPLYDARGRALDADGFVRELRRVLRKEPFNIVCKVVPNGLGKATLYIGGK